MCSADPRASGGLLSTVIVGGGPGGLGPLLCAAQHGSLSAWLEQGVALVERSGRLGGSLGRYAINSDSLGGSYLECLDAAGWPESLCHLRRDPVTLEMERYRTGFPPLPLVDRYMGRIGQALAEMIGNQPSSALHLNTTAKSIRLRDDGSVAVLVRRDGTRPREIIARSAVVALGGRQSWWNLMATPDLRFADCAIRRALPSNILLSQAGLREANEIIRLAADRRIILLGGSHSAYAVAWALLNLPAARDLRDGQIAILQRRPPRVFYADRADATDDLYDVESGDICVRTQRVNRMGGLRGHGRDVWRRITRRPNVPPETRVAVLALQDFSPPDLRTMIEEAALVVPCLGYRSVTLPIYDPSGLRLALKADSNGDVVDESCRLRLESGEALSNVFGIGLGTGFRPTASMGCEPNFTGQANSLWLYQNDIGALIYRAIQAISTERPKAAAA